MTAKLLLGADLIYQPDKKAKANKKSQSKKSTPAKAS